MNVNNTHFDMLKDAIENARNEISELESLLTRRKNTLTRLEEEMLDLCNHTWEIDNRVFDMYERTYRCLHCGLTK